MWTLTESDPPGTDSPEALWVRLYETIAWCESCVDLESPALCLRSPETRPRIMQPSYAAGVEDVSRNRHAALHWPRPKPRRDLAGGRILVYGPDEEASDGAAEAETKGFFDVYNCPPWDTWLALTQFGNGKQGRAAHLFAWIPPAFMQSVERGIFVNPEGCIKWLEDWEAPGKSNLIEALRAVR
jgi:hypothetical protein